MTTLIRVPEQAPNGNSLMNKRILVIDGDPVLLTMTRESLEDAGFKVSTADCGIYSNHIV
jgi:DNA-binding NtrC family response regulator